ncbi:calcium-binding protein, partial [Microvirga arabica]
MAILIGTAGNDTLQGGPDSDTLDGGAGNDTLAGGIGVAGTEVDDRFNASTGNDTIYGGDIGTDDNPAIDFNEIFYINRGFTSIQVQFGSTSRAGTVTKSDGSIDTFFAIDAVRGTDGADTFIGGSGAGTQRFSGFGGNDIFDGTSGVNEVDYRNEARAFGYTAGLTINLAAGLVQDSTGATDTLIAIERVRGTTGNDLIIGNELANRLRGDEGDDTFQASTGNDTIDGGLGNDTVVFSFNRADATIETIPTGLRVRGPEGSGVNTRLDNVENLRFADDPEPEPPVPPDAQALVDDSYYLALYPDVKAAGVDPDD